MGEKHIHAEIIKAWADGADIEWFDRYKGCWVPSPNPMFNEGQRYRVKPRIFTYWIHIAEAEIDVGRLSMTKLYTCKEDAERAISGLGGVYVVELVVEV